MRAAVTGASGFIGRSLCASLRIAGHDVLPLQRGYSLDVVRDFAPEWIFHVAAEIYKDEALFDSNVVLTHDLLRATRDVPYKAFVYVGSSSEYGRKGVPMRETDYLSPTTMYEATKACGSLLCQAAAREWGKPIVATRPFSVYGCYEPAHRLIPKLISAARTGEAVRLTQAVHDFVYISDVVRALQLVASRPIPGDVVNIGTGDMVSNIEVALTMERALDRRVRFEVTGEKMRPFDSNCWCCDTHHASTTYGFDAEYSLYEGLCDYARQYAA